MKLTIYHWLVLAAFIGVVIWVFRRKRKARFEKDARIPFEEDKVAPAADKALAAEKIKDQGTEKGKSVTPTSR